MSISSSIPIAVVDDDPSQRRSFERLLRACGFHPVAYSSAEAFLEDAQKPKFDCLILDIQLGGISGIELQKHLKGHGSSTPAIFITAHDEPEIREQALLTGCFDFFRKTESGEVIIAAIRRAIAGAGPRENSTSPVR